MPEYICTRTQTLVIEATSAAEARNLAEAGFKKTLSPADIKVGMSVSNIQSSNVHVEKRRT